MDKIIEFISNNYAWFLTFTIILLFALIGYIYDNKKNKHDLVKKSEDELEEEVLKNISASDDKTLQDMVAKSKNINPETKEVELTDTDAIRSDENKVQ